jgi:hypothetical protein
MKQGQKQFALFTPSKCVPVLLLMGIGTMVHRIYVPIRNSKSTANGQVSTTSVWSIPSSLDRCETRRIC